MSKQLVIIGNGFDLQLNLKSRFSDFFEEKEIQLVKSWLNSNYSYEKLKEVNFLSLLLYNTFYRENGVIGDYAPITSNYKQKFFEYVSRNGGIVNWMDVEQYICSFLINKNENKIFKCFDDAFVRQLNADNFLCPGDGVAKYFFASKLVKNYQGVSNFYEFFLKELNDFEKRFSDYLNNEVKKKVSYEADSMRLFMQLTENNEDGGTILNFNYTKCSFPDYKTINVHGTLNDKVIIGIDMKTNDNVNVIPFTKTFRKMTANTSKKVLEKGIKEIIIYGHSLGDQDHSYFQSVFDFYDIYHSDVSLIFKYSDNFLKTDLKKKNYKVDYAKKIYKLINEYGMTFDNKDNGKNLLHKLILEGRLSIELVNYDNKTIAVNT